MLGVKRSFRTGFGFGLTSGVITTLGLVVGLYSGTHSKILIISGILLIAIADSLSDSLGIHVSEELKKERTLKEIWVATFTTFFSRFFVVLSLVIPILFFALSTAIIISILWGLFLIGAFSLYIAKQRGESYLKAVFKHLSIAILVIAITYFIGDFVSALI